jgi:hypothetical protein
MKSWKSRLGLVLTMLAMLLAVSLPAVADDAEELADQLFEEGELGADDFDLEDCVLDDGDGLTDEELENLLDDDGDGSVDEDLEDVEVTCSATFEADDFLDDEADEESQDGDPGALDQSENSDLQAPDEDEDDGDDEGEDEEDEDEDEEDEDEEDEDEEDEDED